MKMKILMLVSLLLLVTILLIPGCKPVSSSINGSGKIVEQGRENR